MNAKDQGEMDGFFLRQPEYQDKEYLEGYKKGIDRRLGAPTVDPAEVEE